LESPGPGPIPVEQITVNPDQSLKYTSTRSAIWMGSSSLIIQFLTMITTAVLARLLEPALFGLLTMAMIVLNILGLVAELGLAKAIIQRKQLEERHLSTTFWANIVVALGLAGIAFIIAPFAAAFFDEQAIHPILQALGLTFFLGSFGAVHTALLQKSMEFRTVSIIEIIAQLTYGILVIILALLGYGLWSLVIGVLIKSIVSSALPWFFQPWRPKLIFDRQAFRELFGFGANLMGIRMVVYLRDNIGNAVVGKTLGPAPLGFYNLAFNLTMVPGSKLASVLNRVVFPAFSSIQSEEEKLRRGYLQTVKYVAALTFPLSVGLIVVGPELIKVVYGPKWLSAVPLLQIMGVSGVLNALPALSGGIIEARGRPGLELKLAMISYPVYFCLLLIGLNWGLVGIAWATSINKLIFIVAGIILSCYVINLPLRAYVAAVSASVIGVISMALVVLGWRSLALHVLRYSDLLLLGSSVILGAGVYFVVLLILRERALIEICKLFWAIARPPSNTLQPLPGLPSSQSSDLN